MAGLDIGIHQLGLFVTARGLRNDGWGARMQPLSESANKDDYSPHERTERYRREAARLHDIAEVTLDPQARQELLDIARNYEILAMALELLPADRPA